MSLTVSHIGPAYPNELPLIHIQSGLLSNQMIRSMTVHAAKKSQELAGSPMVHELLTSACEFLASAPDDVPEVYEETARFDDEASTRATQDDEISASAPLSENQSCASKVVRKNHSRGKQHESNAKFQCRYS